MDSPESTIDEYVIEIKNCNWQYAAIFKPCVDHYGTNLNLSPEQDIALQNFLMNFENAIIMLWYSFNDCIFVNL